MSSTAIQSREQLLFALCEAAELEHNLMCTYLYAAFSLKDRDDGGLSVEESETVARWRSTILGVATEEMGHLAAVWNITSALGGSPPFGRDNFPLSPGRLPAGIVVKLAPFGHEALQHFIHLERPTASLESDGVGFEPELQFRRGISAPRLTPMPIDYQTVGEFYLDLEANLRAFAGRHGEAETFCGDRNLQLSPHESNLKGAEPVICLKTASAALKYIVEQGEGAPEHSANSHFARFMKVRDELEVLKKKNPDFEPAFPAAVNPLLRLPVRPEGRIWIENEAAASVVDLANSGYALMLRLLAYSYSIPSPEPEKSLAVGLSLGLMRAVTCLSERAARLPIGPSRPNCTAGVTFSALRDASALPRGAAARRLFSERFSEILAGAERISSDGDARTSRAVRLLSDLNKRASRGFAGVASSSKRPEGTANVVSVPGVRDLDPRASPAPTSRTEGDIEYIEGQNLTLIYEGKKCIHARFCVTGAPEVFLANVKGPWIKPDATDSDNLAEIAHACPSGAIRYKRKDGKHDESAPPVNLIAVREGGPYAVHADIQIEDQKSFYRATLCRCGASKNKPFCDGSHHEISFSATGEPPSGSTDMLPVRNGPLGIEPELDGPLQIRGNVEIVSGTGRVVARLAQARLCRCGGSASKPFCDGTHARIGFRSS